MLPTAMVTTGEKPQKLRREIRQMPNRRRSVGGSR